MSRYPFCRRTASVALARRTPSRGKIEAKKMLHLRNFIIFALCNGNDVKLNFCGNILSYSYFY